MNSQKLTLDLYDYTGNRICPLYDSSSDVSGQAYNVFIQTERNGWKQLSFDLPAKMQTENGEEDNFRTELLRSDYRIRSEDEKEVDWFLVNENKISHKAMSKDISVVAGHISQMLKQKNLGLEFSDEDGNNVGTAAELLAAVLAGTGWAVGRVEDFREDDGSIKYRSLRASAKTGAFKLITMIADMFEAKPIFHGEGKTVDLIPMNPFTVDDNELYPDVTKADAVAELHYGVNVSNVQRTIDTENIATKLHVYGSYGDDTYGYCSIDECVHSIRNMVIKDTALDEGSLYFFKIKDDSGVEITRYFRPDHTVYVGDSLIFSFLDPASQMYVWHSPQFPSDDFDGAPYPCYENTEETATEVLFNLSKVDPVWTKTYEDNKISALTQELTMTKNESHHWYFPDCDQQFRVDVYKRDLESGIRKLSGTYTGSNVKFDVELENPENEAYEVEVRYSLSTVNYTLNEINELKKKHDLILRTGSVRLAAVNWLNFIMNFNYYRRNGTLTDDTVKKIAEYQTRAPEYYRQAHDASLRMSDDISELNKYIGTANFCRINIAGVDPTPDIDEEGTQRERLRIDKSEEYPDGVLYRSDYYITNKKNYFKWTGVPKLTEDGRPESGVASVLYIVHDINPVTWDRAFLYNDRQTNLAGVLEDPDYLILHAAPGQLTIDAAHDKFFLFQSLTGGGYLATYETMEEAAVKALSEVVKEATYEHPVYFGTVPPDEISDIEKAVRTKTGDYADIYEFLGQEYSWYWQYDESGLLESKMYFCYKDAGDVESIPRPDGSRLGVYFPVHYQSTQPVSCKERDYWFDYKKSKLYRFTDGEWVLLDNSTERAIAGKFGTVHQQCMRRDLARNGLREKYTYTVPDSEDHAPLPRGNYYIESGKGTAWITSTTKDLPPYSTLTYNRRQNAVFQVSGTGNIMLNTKTVDIDAVSYHAQNLVEEGMFIQGWINDDGSIDDSDPECCYTRAAMYCYPNTEYEVTFFGPYDYRIIEYTEANTNKRFLSYHDHTGGSTETFTTDVNTNYMRMCIKVPPDTANEAYLPTICATCKDRAFVTEGVNYIKLDNVVQEGDLAGVRPAIEKLSVYGDKVYLEDYGDLKSAQGVVDQLMQVMNEDLGDMLREGYWQDNSYVDGDEAKLYADALKKLAAIAEPEIKYNVRYIDNREAIEDDDYYAVDLTKGVKWPWITTETAVHLLDPEIGVDVWAYVDKVNRCYTDPRKTTISINTNLSTITQHSFGDVLSNIANVANETRTSSVGGLRKVNEGVDTVSNITAAYQQQLVNDATSLNSTISSLRTIITGIQENYISGVVLSDYSTIQQTSDAITTTVTNIQKEISGGANLIKKSNFFIYKTNLDTESVSYRLDLADEYVNNVFINQYLTLSYYLESIGDRARLVGSDSMCDNFFGAGLAVVWGASNEIGSSAREDKVAYYMFDMCEAEGRGRRVSATAKIEPPEEGYDTIKDMYVSVQLTARPDALNDNTWVFGQPQLEVGKFCTGYKESAFEIKAFAQSQIQQTAEEISARVQHLTDEFNKATKVTINEDGVVIVAQNVENVDKTVTIDPDPYSHPKEQWAITASPTVVPEEHEWMDVTNDSDKQAAIARWTAAWPDSTPYEWYRSIVLSGENIVSSTAPQCIDPYYGEGTPILSAQDQYCYISDMDSVCPNPRTVTHNSVYFTYLDNYRWSIRASDSSHSAGTMTLFSKNSGMPTGITAGSTIYVDISKDEDPDQNVSVIVDEYDSENTRKRTKLTSSNPVTISDNTVSITIAISVKANILLDGFEIGVIISKKPGTNATWLDEYRGPRNGYSVWVRTHITYNIQGQTMDTDPIPLDMRQAKNVNVQYAVLAKGETPTESTVWSSKLIDVVNANQVVWTRIEYTKLDNSKYITEPIPMRDNYNTPSVKSVETYYYCSANDHLTLEEINNHTLWIKTEVCETGKSLWARNLVTFSDGTIMWCEPQICSAYNALFLQEDMTIGSTGIEVRYALSNSPFVPPRDNANWMNGIPQVDSNKPEYKYIWFSTWTWCKNGDVYKSIPIYITDKSSINNIVPRWKIIEGNDMPTISINNPEGWYTFDNNSYITKPSDPSRFHMWVCITYTLVNEDETQEQCVTDFCRAKYYDNIIDDGYNVYKSREEMLNDRYVRELYAAQYDEFGNTLGSDITRVTNTAKGIYNYLSGNDATAIMNLEPSAIVTQLTESQNGIMSELKQTTDEIRMIVGEPSKNLLANSEKVEVIDYDRDIDVPEEIQLSNSFDIDNRISGNTGDPISDINNATARITSQITHETTTATIPSTQKTIRVGSRTTVDMRTITTTLENVEVKSTGSSQRQITFTLYPLARDTSNGSDVLTATVRAYKPGTSDSDPKTELTPNGSNTCTVHLGVTSSDGSISAPASAQPTAFSFITNQEDVMDVIVQIVFTAPEGITYIQTNVLIGAFKYDKFVNTREVFTRYGGSIANNIVLADGHYINYTFSANLSVSSASNNTTFIDVVKHDSTELVRRYTISATQSTVSFGIEASDFETNEAYDIWYRPPEVDVVCTYSLTNVTILGRGISTVTDSNVSLTADNAIKQGRRYVLHIASCRMGEGSENVTHFNIGIPSSNGSHTLISVPLAGFSNYEYIIESAEGNGNIVVYAGLNGHTEGVRLILEGIYVYKYPKYSSETNGVKFISTSSFTGTGKPHIFSVISVLNNDYTLSANGINTINDKALLDTIRIGNSGTVTCSVCNETANTKVTTELNISDGRQFFSFSTVKDAVYHVDLYANSKNGTRRGGSITYSKIMVEEIDEKNEEIDGVIQPTEWRVKNGESDGSFRNSVIVINEEGIKASGGVVDIQAGSRFNVGSEGIVTIKSANAGSSIKFEELVDDPDSSSTPPAKVLQTSFEVAPEGYMYTKEAHIDKLIVNGKELSVDALEAMINDRVETYIKQFFIRASKAEDLPPNGLSHDYYWLRPNHDAENLGAAGTTVEDTFVLTSEQKINSTRKTSKFTIKVNTWKRITSENAKYELSFQIRNTTRKLDYVHAMFLNAIRLYAKGVGYNSSVEQMVLCKSERFDSPTRLLKGNSLTISIVSDMAANMACAGPFEFYVEMDWGCGLPDVDEFEGVITTAPITVKMHIPPRNNSIQLDSITRVPYDIYHVPAGTAVKTGSSSDSSEGSGDTSGNETGG